MDQTATGKAQRGNWSSETAFIFSMAAAAAGLGNLWRFPYIAGENGGGAFILAYLAALFVVVLPVMVLEVAAGRLAEGNTVQTYRAVRRMAAIYGWFVVGLTIVITSYYLVVTGWTLGFAMDSVRGNLRPFAEFSEGYASVWYFLAVLVLAWLLLIRGLGGLERFSKAMMPVLFVVIAFLAVRGMAMPGWDEAVAFLFQSDLSRLGDRQVWVMAFGQAFYSLAIGQGYLVTYGSYVPRHVHLLRACIIVAVAETMVALAAGLMIFPYVFSLGIDPAQGSDLALSVMPRVFAELSYGAGLAILFFGLFFLAAFSSAVAGMKVIISAVAEEFSMAERKAVALTAIGLAVLGLPSALSFTPLALTIAGRPVLEWVDQAVGTHVVLASGLFGAAFLAWFVPRERLDLALASHGRWFQQHLYIVGRWLPPLILIWLTATYVLTGE